MTSCKSNQVIVLVEACRKGAPLPCQSTTGAACHDIKYWPGENGGPVSVGVGKIVKVPTGLIFKIPQGWEMTIRGRSGLATKGIRVHPGTIDSDYRGEVMVLMTSDDQFRVIQPGDNVAQIALRRLPDVVFQEVPSISVDTKRGTGGFGHTGR